MDSEEAILRELKSLLTTDKNQKETNTCMLPIDIDSDETIISLYDVAKLIKIPQKDYEDKVKEFERYLKTQIPSKWFGEKHRIKVNFNHFAKELKIQRQYLDTSITSGIRYVTDTTAIITKKDGNLQITGGFYNLKNNPFVARYYDELESFSPFFTEYNSKIRPVNSNFLVAINSRLVQVISDLTYDFTLSSESSKPDKVYQNNSLSFKISNAIENREEEIFKRIFINIEDCPNWAKETLYEIRQKQLSSKMLKLKNKVLSLLAK